MKKWWVISEKWMSVKMGLMQVPDNKWCKGYVALLKSGSE